MEKSIDELYQDELKDFRLTLGGKNMLAIAEGMGQLEILKRKLQEHRITPTRTESVLKEIGSIKNNLIFLIQEYKKSICPPNNSPQPISRKATKKKSKLRK